MTEHTHERPWRAIKDIATWAILDKDGKIILGGIVEEEIARLIVTVCNSHAELLEACKLTATIVIDKYDASDEPLNAAWHASVKAIRHVEEQA